MIPMAMPVIMQMYYYNGQEIKLCIQKLYYKFNKPIGVECSANPRVKNNIVDFLMLNQT